MINTDNEEAVHSGFAANDLDSIRPLREALICLLHGWPIPDATLARLIGLDEDALALRRGLATLKRRPLPDRAAYLDPNPAQPSASAQTSSGGTPTPQG